MGERDRQAALAMARQLFGEPRERLIEWLRTNGVPPLNHPDLTAEQALRARAFLANMDAVDGEGSGTAA